MFECNIIIGQFTQAVVLLYCWTIIQQRMLVVDNIFFICFSKVVLVSCHQIVCMPKKKKNKKIHLEYEKHNTA